MEGVQEKEQQEKAQAGFMPDIVAFCCEF